MTLVADLKRKSLGHPGEEGRAVQKIFKEASEYFHQDSTGDNEPAAENEVIVQKEVCSASQRESIKQRFKKSATVGEVEDVGTGRQLLEMGILLAFLAALPAAMFVYVAMTFICAGGVACGNPLETLLFGHPV